MNLPNYLARTEYYGAKAATKRLVELSGGPKAASQVARLDAPRLSRCGDIQDQQAFISIDAVMDLEASTGSPVISTFLADLCGYVLVPKAVANAKADLLDLIGRISRESGDIVADTAVAIADGVLDPKERAALGEGIRRAMEALAALEKCVAEAAADGVINDIRKG